MVAQKNPEKSLINTRQTSRVTRGEKNCENIACLFCYPLLIGFCPGFRVVIPLGPPCSVPQSSQTDSPKFQHTFRLEVDEFTGIFVHLLVREGASSSPKWLHLPQFPG